MASTSSLTDKTQKEVPTVCSSGTSHVTLPLSGSQRATRVFPIIPSALGEPNLQPTTLVFPSGVAFDYNNYPKLVSVCWPVTVEQSGNSVVANNVPINNGLSRGINNGTNSTHRQELQDIDSVFRWDQPPKEDKEPVTGTPGIKAPICATYNSCNGQNETLTKSASGCVANSTVLQQIPSLVRPCAYPILEPSMFKRPKLQQIEVSGRVVLNYNNKDGHLDGDINATSLRILDQNLNLRAQPKPGSLGSLHDQRNEKQPASGQVLNSRTYSEQATIRQIVGKQPTRIKAYHFSFYMPEETKQGTQLEGGDTSHSVNQKKEKLVDSSSNVPNNQPSEQCSEGTSENIATGPQRKIISTSSTDVELAQQDKPGREGAEERCSQPSSPKKTRNSPVVIEDDATETAFRNNVEISEKSPVYISAPNHGTSRNAGCLPTPAAHISAGSVSQSTASTGSAPTNLESGSKRNNVRDLIARIRYIKSRLHRAEDEQRKKQMLKAILGLQKRVKALTKGMRNEKTDTAKKEEVTTDRSDKSGTSTSGQELRKVNHYTVSESHAWDIIDANSQAGHVTQSETGFGNKEDGRVKRDGLTSTDIPKEGKETNSEGQEHCNEQITRCLGTSHPHKDEGDVQMKETKESKSTEVSRDKDGDTNMVNNNNKRQERASLSLLNSEGILKDPVVTLPAGIGLDSPPGTSRKRSFSSSNVVESEFQRNESPTSKKIKRLSLSDKDVMHKINTASPSSLDITHEARSVTQVKITESLLLNEKHADNELNVMPEKMSFLPAKDEMDKSGSNSCSLQDVSNNAHMQDEPMGRVAPNEKNEVKNCVTLKANVTGKELSNLRAKYEMDKSGTFPCKFQDVTHNTQIVCLNAGAGEDSLPNELNKEDSAVQPDKTNAAQKCDLSFNDNGSTNSVTYDDSDDGSVETTQETVIAQNEGDKEQNSLGHDVANYVSQPTFSSNTVSTQVNDEGDIEKKEPAKSPLVDGLQDEIGGAEHSHVEQDDERGCSVTEDRLDDIYNSASSTSNENNVEMEENLLVSSQVYSVHEPFTREMRDFDVHRFNDVPLQDNENDQELFRLSLQTIQNEERTRESFTSPTLHNPSGRQEDVDLMQSLQIRQARILNLTQKRDRLFDLVMNRL